MTAQWVLGDGEATHREFPRTFSIPRGAVRRALPVGCQARLTFRIKQPKPDSPRAERMWCRVLEQRGDVYVGELLNAPVYLSDLRVGARVEFQARHVIAVTYVEDRSMRALVGADLGVLREGAQPEWLIRVAPVDAQDSGWRVFSAPKSASASRLRAVTANMLLDCWPPLDTVLDGVTTGVWQWNERDLEFVAAAELPEALKAVAAAGLGRLPPVPASRDLSAIVTNGVLDRFPLRAERVPPSKNREDSGWCFFVGDETSAQLDDAKNFTAVPLGRLTVLYPALERLTGETGEHGWQWDDALGDFARI